MKKKQIKSGLDAFLECVPDYCKNRHAGLAVHPASVNADLNHAFDLLYGHPEIQVKALFGPQHGIHGQTQDNMVEWQGFKEPRTGIDVFSLYGAHRKPLPEWIENLSVMIVDFQDVGTRYYTYGSTLSYLMESCSEAGIPLVVMDRPNPITGKYIEGNLLLTEYASFVGRFPIPVRHSLTLGELARYISKEHKIDLELEIMPMKGWKRNMWFDESGLPWVMPSPNMPTLETAVVYPGMCLLEGTNVSEGRGTTRPFEIFGAPFIDPYETSYRLNEKNLPGVRFRPMHFLPTFQKWKGKLCGGCRIHVTDRDRYQSYLTGLTVLHEVMHSYRDDFRWKQPPYEYENEKMPIDILTGNPKIREDLEKGSEPSAILSQFDVSIQEYRERVRQYYLY